MTLSRLSPEHRHIAESDSLRVSLFSRDGKVRSLPLNSGGYPIHTGKLEGVNNKIKVIKRKAYGFHDLRYFTLKIYQVFCS